MEAAKVNWIGLRDFDDFARNIVHCLEYAVRSSKAAKKQTMTKDGDSDKTEKAWCKWDKDRVPATAIGMPTVGDGALRTVRRTQLAICLDKRPCQAACMLL